MVCGMEDAELRRNLKDAGCSAALIRQCMNMLEAGAIPDCSRLLDSYRRTLLDDIHTKEETLSCLDYLRYRLQKA